MECSLHSCRGQLHFRILEIWTADYNDNCSLEIVRVCFTMKMIESSVRNNYKVCCNFVNIAHYMFNYDPLTFQRKNQHFRFNFETNIKLFL